MHKLKRAVKQKSFKRVLKVLEKSNDLSQFVKVRERCFAELTTTVEECLRNYALNIAQIEELALKFEQPAILGCMQTITYQKLIKNIIGDFRNSENLHPAIQRELDTLKIQIINEVQLPEIKKINDKDRETADSKLDEQLNDKVCSETISTINKSSLEDSSPHSLDISVEVERSEEDTSFLDNILKTMFHHNCEREKSQELPKRPRVIKKETSPPPMVTVPLSNKPLPKPDELFDEIKKPLIKDNIEEMFESLEKDLEALHQGTYLKKAKSHEDFKNVEPGDIKSFRFWQREHYIFAHSLSFDSKKLTPQKYAALRSTFLDLFGWDSDDEYEEEFSCRSKYLDYCAQRITSTIARYLMPYYKQRRIVGSLIFKNLAHRIAESLVERIEYPNDWEIKSFVSKFFPKGKKYLHVNDVWGFLINN